LRVVLSVVNTANYKLINVKALTTKVKI
jgi:hypothetical protein